MEEKVIRFEKNNDRYKKVAKELAEKGEFEKALNLLFSVLNDGENYEILSLIADLYAHMGLLELSNKYWYKCISRASKEKLGKVYEEIAINYFYLEDYYATSYYFYKQTKEVRVKLSDDVDQEIIEFFLQLDAKKSMYYIAYPFNRADYSKVYEKARIMLAVGKFSDSAKLLSKIPIECITQEQSEMQATGYLMSNQFDKAIESCRQSIEKHGENVGAYCNLSTIYGFKGEKEKCAYYYKKAIELWGKDKEEAYKIITCAVEQNDYEVAVICLEQILQEKPYDVVMLYYYAIANLNLGNFEQAEKQILKLYRLDPYDVVVKYYVEFIEKIKNGDVKAQAQLPLCLLKNIPRKEQKAYSKKIKQLASNPETIALEMKKQSVKELLRWGVKSGIEQTVKEAIYILSTNYTDFSKKVIEDTLIDTHISVEVKKVLVYALLLNQNNEKFGVVAENFYAEIKPKKLNFTKKDKTGLYIRAYAFAMSKMVFTGLKNVEKIATSANQIYKKLSKIISEEDVTNNELALLMVLESNFKSLDDEILLCYFFDVEKGRIEQLKKLLKGEVNDKNN